MVEYWKDDGAGNTASDAGKLTCTVPSSTDTPTNAMYTDDQGMSGGKHEFEFKISNHCGIGVTTEAKFARGYKSRGMMYNGNLSDGIGMISEFGPSLKDGDTVRMACVYEGGKLKVYFTINGAHEGLAFDVEAPASPTFPVVSMRKKDTVITVTKLTTVSGDVPFEHPSGILGHWKDTAPPTVPYYGVQDVKLKILEQTVEGGYKAQAKPHNSIMVDFKKTAAGFSATLGAMTRMAGPPELMEFEKGFIDFLKESTNIKLDGAVLSVVGPSQTRTFVRDESHKNPCTKNILD